MKIKWQLKGEFRAAIKWLNSNANINMFLILMGSFFKIHYHICFLVCFLFGIEAATSSSINIQTHTLTHSMWCLYLYTFVMIAD